MAKQELLDTLWEVPDDLWAEIAPLIAELDPPKSTGRKRQDPRQDAQRNHLPAALRLPMESTAPFPRGRQHHPPHLAAVGAGWAV